jgi:hypothetical protein
VIHLTLFLTEYVKNCHCLSITIDITYLSKVKVMKNTRLTLIGYISATFVALILAACGGDGGGGGGGVSSMGTASISLTDAPIDDAKEVVVRFEGAEFQPANGERVMVYLSDTTGTGNCEVVVAPDPTKPCEVDLTDYTGTDKVELLDNATLPAGQYNWIRLILNANPGYITLLNDSQFDLRVPSGAQTGLKIHSGFVVAAGNHTNYTIDFNLRASVHDPVGSSEYILRPTVRMVDESLIGTLSGNVNTSFFVADPACTGAVYVFDDGTPGTPDDVDGDASDPITTALVPNDGTHAYMVGFLTEGDYLIAFTCDALADVPTVDDGAVTVDFLSQTTVHITAGANTDYDFPPAP